MLSFPPSAKRISKSATHAPILEIKWEVALTGGKGPVVVLPMELPFLPTPTLQVRRKAPGRGAKLERTPDKTLFFAPSRTPTDRKERAEAVNQEFHLSVTSIGRGEYFVRTEYVAPGVPLAEEQFSWPVEAWLEEARQLMQNPLAFAIAQNPDRGEGDGTQLAEREARGLIALGQELHDSLFQGRIRDSWLTARGIARNRQAVLRLRLGLKDDRLAALPWEVLHSGDRALATGTNIAFSRFRFGTGHLDTFPPPNQPLKILMAIAAPSDREGLKLQRECEELRQELRSHGKLHPYNTPHNAPEIQLSILQQPDREELTRALEHNHYQVLHYAGHSSFGTEGGQLYLVSNKTGLAEPLGGDDLAGLLANNGVQLAVFNSCRGAYAATDAVGASERNLSEASIARGIPAVLAMAERIPDEVALTLSRLFYRNLSQGHPVDVSLNRARQGLISAYGSNQLYWALPILSMHPEFDGYLYEYIEPDEEDNWGETHSGASFLSPLSGEAVRKNVLRQPPSERSAEGEENSMPEIDWDGMADEVETDGEADPEAEEGWDYAEDSAIVSELFQQLSQEEAIAPGSKPEGPPFGAIADRFKSSGEPSRTLAPPQLSMASQTAGAKGKISKVKRRSMVGAAIAGVAAISLGALLWSDRRAQTTPPTELPAVTAPLGTEPVAPPPPAWQNADNNEVMLLAMQKFAMGDRKEAVAAVEALLDRNALPYAEQALQQAERGPEINFLFGRLAWQFVQTQGGETFGPSDVDRYSADDALRYWQTAIEASPKEAKYHTAIGFLYYNQGDLQAARQAWQNVWDLTGGDTDNPAFRNALAGLALSEFQAIEDLPPDERQPVLSRALKTRQSILNLAPIDFTVEALAQNWLWPESAIADWQQLMETSL